MKKKEIVTLYLTMGLPGSGKSTWSIELCQSDKRIYYVDFDRLSESFKQSLLGHLQNLPSFYSNGSIIDSCIFNTNDILSLLSYLVPTSSYNKLEIHYWKPDIEACLWNDRGRRKEDSEITIKNAKIEYPDLKVIESYVLENIPSIDQCKVVEHKVERKPEWKVFADESELHYDKKNITSSSWSGGGTYENCWGTGGSIVAEEPVNFDEFDEILEKFAPDISHKMYKEIWNNTVDVENYGESDYYGGYETKHYYTFNLPIFYQYLIDNNLIERI